MQVAQSDDLRDGRPTHNHRGCLEASKLASTAPVNNYSIMIKIMWYFDGFTHALLSLKPIARLVYGRLHSNPPAAFNMSDSQSGRPAQAPTSDFNWERLSFVLDTTKEVC